MEKNGLPKRKIFTQLISDMTKLIVLTEIYETDSISSVFKTEEGRFEKRESQFSLREILVNPEYIVSDEPNAKAPVPPVPKNELSSFKFPSLY